MWEGQDFFSLAAHTFFHYLFLKVKHAIPNSQDFTYVAGKKKSSLFWQHRRYQTNSFASWRNIIYMKNRTDLWLRHWVKMQEGWISLLTIGIACALQQFLYSWCAPAPFLPWHQSQRFCRDKFIRIEFQRKIVAWKASAASTCFCAYSQMGWALIMVEGR